MSGAGTVSRSFKWIHPQIAFSGVFLDSLLSEEVKFCFCENCSVLRKCYAVPGNAFGIWFDMPRMSLSHDSNKFQWGLMFHQTTIIPHKFNRIKIIGCYI